ncbi:MAG: hypothetical protein RBT55_08300 [Rhodocyclaceae bacterium]|jgi:hypothetical protein|nr:hypothetical protein [Rhodocyclaceae bacterium]
MKLSKLTGKLGELLSADLRKQRKKREKLIELLKQMKKQQRQLENDIENMDDPETRAGLELKLQILVEQRKKGVRLRKALAGKRPEAETDKPEKPED